MTDQRELLVFVNEMMGLSPEEAEERVSAIYDATFAAVVESFTKEQKLPYRQELSMRENIARRIAGMRSQLPSLEILAQSSENMSDGELLIYSYLTALYQAMHERVNRLETTMDHYMDQCEAKGYLPVYSEYDTFFLKTANSIFPQNTQRRLTPDQRRALDKPAGYPEDHR